MIVRSPFGRSRLGVPSFRISHGFLLGGAAFARHQSSTFQFIA
jgi:hypothetical protein